MENKRRFTILPFPQHFDGTHLSFNFVVLPRNQNPMISADGQTDTPAFVDAEFDFEAKFFHGLQTYPHRFSDSDVALTTTKPVNSKSLFEALASHLKIYDPSPDNSNLQNNFDKISDAKPQERSVSKYLPKSYRSSFNFTTPRTRNAKTDDSYQCAVRDAKRNHAFKQSPDTVSWGRVFAYAMRQPMLAKELGMIYEIRIPIEVANFEEGGWLYIDLTTDSDYFSQLNAESDFIKKYAARIPALKADEERSLFAPLLFPVLHKVNESDPDPIPNGNYDQLFIEAAEYDDGFAKIVHSFQPCNLNLLVEENTGAHPVKESGIRLGWDDEQILIWYMRQMMIDTSVDSNILLKDKRIDASLGVNGYSIDVREVQQPIPDWDSLNAVTSKTTLTLNNKNNSDAPIPIGDFDGELLYQVYPSQIDGNKDKSYWLPMHFANWNGKSMVLSDTDASDIYHTNDPTIKPDPKKLNSKNVQVGTGVTKPAQNQLNDIYAPVPITTELQYGKQYDFRVRMRDLSGGGPSVKLGPINETPSDIARCRFKRYIAPNKPRIKQMREEIAEGEFNNVEEIKALAQLNINRPLLGYPAVVYTGKYADPIGLLKTASTNMMGKEGFGISDPDVDRVEIIVEVQSLKMDKLLSASGKEDYIHYYTTYRDFPTINSEADYDAELVLPIIYKDAKVLHTGDAKDIEADLGLLTDIDSMTDIVLPTARTIRLTVRSVCENKEENGNEEYYGSLDEENSKLDNRFSQVVEVLLYSPSVSESDLFVDASPAKMLKGIYLQPDPPFVFDGKLETILLGKTEAKPPDAIQLLADQLDIENLGLSLIAPKGERIHFGCSNRIRHTLAPDNSSLTFASKGDLKNHWLCCLQLQINRDWTWDAVQDLSFVITRTKRFTNDDEATETEISEVGEIELSRIASFGALMDSKRDSTQLIFIDAVEPKTELKQPAPNEEEPRFPDTIEVSYTIETRFKENHAEEKDAPLMLEITLPITTPPKQIPAIVSAGIALSPYRRNEKYSTTEPRRQYLWIELEEPIQDPNDTYFARVLANAPDQLISNNHPDLFIAPREPSLPISPEHIRVIPPDGTNDLAGLNAMQPMEKSTDSDLHYLLPLPPGLHPNADEMFGFFTYEFRVGHYRNSETNEMVWSTAQGRFGRRLRATGIQHPAPTLSLSVNRDEKKLYVTAPYASAVFKGKNVTSNPPRTQLWCLLYAQVKQADNKDYRNILLTNKQLDWRVKVEHDKEVNRVTKYSAAQRKQLAKLAVRNLDDELDIVKARNFHKLTDFELVNKDATKMGTVIWSNDEISRYLELYGLPGDAALSVLVVEFFGNITNIHEHINGLDKKEVLTKLKKRMPKDAELPLDQKRIISEKEKLIALKDNQIQLSPLSDQLGHHRILRTSPLVEVPFVCCTNC